MQQFESPRQISQRGLTLMIVLVVLLLATLLVIAAARTAWFTERLIGADADHERAFSNAQALLVDAEYDIRAESPDGHSCAEASAAPPRNCRAQVSADASEAPWIPRGGMSDFMRLRVLLTTHSTGAGFACAQGVCLADALPQGFWKLPPATLARIQGAGARYAQFSGAPAAPTDNPLLSTQGWYWIEILPYAGPAGMTAAPDADNPFIFRITALALGRRPTTRVVLQRLFVWKRVDS